MTFVLIKAFSTLLYPLFSSIVAVSLGLALRRHRRVIGNFLVIGGLVYLYVCSTGQFADWLARTIEDDFDYVEISDVPKADVVLVLGGGVGRKMGVLELNDSADRVLQGARLLKAEKVPLVIVSAGHGYGTNPQSRAMREFLIELGVAEGRIVEETQAQTTYEHAVYLKPIFEERGIRSVILVTSAWHMRRSLAVFESHMSEYEIFAYPVDFESGKTNSIVDFLPRAESLSKSTLVIREYVGYILYDIRGWIR